MDKTVTEMLPSVPVTIIGTMSDDVPKTGTIAVTPAAWQPNLKVQVVTPLMAILVRAGNTFFVTLSGSFGGMTLGLIPPTTMKGLVIAALSVVVADALKNAGTVFGNLEKRFPLLTGNI